MSLVLSDTTVPVSLRRLFAAASFVGCGDIAVTDVTEDSRSCRAGCLFAALPGTRTQGLSFVNEAIERGASSLLVDRPLPDCPVPQCIVPNSRVAFAQLCEALYGYPSRRLATVGVTGTNGKTTVTWLVRSILEASARPTALLGTIEYSDGMVSQPASLTTPSTRETSRWLASAVARASQCATLEISSHALDQARVAGLMLDVAIVTNITQDHFDYHLNFEAYRRSKARILRQLKRRGLVVLNADDPGSMSLLGQTTAAAQVVTYGIDHPADVMAESVELGAGGSSFVLRTGVETVRMQTPLVGRHNVSNCLAASAAARHLGVPLSEIAEGCEALESVPGRLERIRGSHPFEVYVDYAHTDDALRRALSAVQEVTRGRVFCVFGAGGDRDRSKRPLMGRAAGSADVVVVTSDNPRSEDPSRIIDDILAGCRASGAELHVDPDRAEAIRWAIEQAEPEDAVLVAGKGHETVQIIGNERRPFDDRAVCRDVLRELCPTTALRFPSSIRRAI
jgi:UDP-N-acetylmuramoyl-L-alanyl-D-glutamate--2,6-diaminopimelate ligase